jgi:hypothetical protein
MGKLPHPIHASSDSETPAPPTEDEKRAAARNNLVLAEEQLPGYLSAENFRRLEERVDSLERVIFAIEDAAGSLGSIRRPDDGEAPA